ncbi:folylpolyglutamate synthase/dihydrofolate synthase family protein [Niallia sp. NCCP-28]|uniref:bifunctional folylpolyglutamate synthase/dihydrofolate synthase n=1 Tax=Niallia sp. NCCP-28 TaxID=2934712 RepID=UPI00208917E0|nr:folylpolyglutamate synthase/dihydrofolate synthase family protein [Niallia sp. NCCP-28]GKU81457.1 bifunctional folylpolyglutamate synthase/dihydrofolate synthase [Niallia sp. NCCP-28]
MFQTYEDSLGWIHSRLRLGIKPGLTRMNRMMEKLNFPDEKLKTVHIGGTNGKGSTVTYLRCILESGGLTVGTYTSPYIEQFNERISINGEPISDEDIIKLCNILYPIVAEMDQMEIGGPTEFEIITAMSFYYFAFIKPVDIVIYEVGLGGRFDSTNIIYPILSIITSIGLDHTAILGDTYEEIAREKAGIIKKNTPIIAAIKQEEALAEIIKKAETENAPTYFLDKHFIIDNLISWKQGESFTFQTAAEKLEDLQIVMMGKHQIENASLAVMAASLLRKEIFPQITQEHIRLGLKGAKWPGRFEMVSEKPLVILDGAHNEEGVQALTAELTKRFKDKKKAIIFAALSDKKTDKMIYQLDRIADKIIFVSFDYPRAATCHELYKESRHQQKTYSIDWKKSIEEQLEEMEEDSMLIVTGSLYFLSAVKAYWKGKRTAK